MYDINENSICQIVCPNSYFEEENDGFLIKQLDDANYCQVVIEITKREKDIMEQFEFPFIEWSNFNDYFEILED